MLCCVNSFLLFSQIQTRRIDAIPLAVWRSGRTACRAEVLHTGQRRVIKHMPQMPAALSAHDFGAHHAVRGVLSILYRTGQGMVKARPTGARVKLGIGREQRRSATCAEKCALLLAVPILSRKRRLRPFFSQNRILLRG